MDISRIGAPANLAPEGEELESLEVAVDPAPDPDPSDGKLDPAEAAVVGKVEVVLRVVDGLTPLCKLIDCLAEGDERSGLSFDWKSAAGDFPEDGRVEVVLRVVDGLTPLCKLIDCLAEGDERSGLSFDRKSAAGDFPEEARLVAITRELSWITDFEEDV